MLQVTRWLGDCFTKIIWPDEASIEPYYLFHQKTVELREGEFAGLKLSLQMFWIGHISMTLYLFSVLVVTTHALHLTSLLSSHHHYSKSLIDPSDMLHLIFGTSFLHHSGFLVRIIHPLSATFIWTCRFNLLHTAITFHHFFTVSLWAQNLPAKKILSSALVCFCL